MRVLAALYVLAPTAAVVVAASLWADRRYIAAWLRWRAARPALSDALSYEEFQRKLALWKIRRPVKSSSQWT